MIRSLLILFKLFKELLPYSKMTKQFDSIFRYCRKVDSEILYLTCHC